MQSSQQPSDPIESRRRYVDAFNSTLVKIWQEKLALLKIIDTGALFRSFATAYAIHDSEVTQVMMHLEFHEYGTYADRGTGRETPRGNPGDIGRAKVRRPRPWINKKYYASLYNLRDFYIQSLNQSVVAIFTHTFTT